MFDDPKNDLKRLEEELRAAQEEETESTDWLAEARNLMDREFETEGDAVFLEDEEEDDSLSVPVPEKKKRVGGLVFLMVLELLGIAAVAYWWTQWLK